MSVLHFFFQLFIEPLVVLFEYIFAFSAKLMGDSAWALIPLSLAVNLLSLPLYRRADAIRQQNRAQERKMEAGLHHIRKHFKGDERFFLTQAYYRISGYKPIYALRNSLSLLLQIPFFIAAYVMLSNLPEFQEKSFGLLANLGEPDKLLIVEGLGARTFTVNVLPILMTIINLVSGFVYDRKNAGVWDKIQLYGLALVFLVLLYNSASGLVLYWILNQLFSLGKNIVDNIRSRKAGTGRVAEVPTERDREKSVPVSFLLGGAVLAVLTGALIPSAVISSSVASFVNVWNYHSPLLNVANAFLVALGAFIFWPGVFYYLARDKWKRVLAAGMWCLVGVAVADYMFFGRNAGTLRYTLAYESGLSFPLWQMGVNLLVAGALVALFILAWRKWNKAVRPALAILLLVTAGMTFSNCAGIRRQLPDIEKAVARHNAANDASIPLSRDGKNVIVLMLDKAISTFVPYLFEEKPELREMFSGFTYYPNALSFGAATNTGSPALFGGYEYTPEEMNRRDREALVKKHNEALRLMPRLFSDNGYTVTVCDPPYAGYKEPADLSIFDDIPGIRAFNLELRQPGAYAFVEKIWEKNFFCYSLMKISPLALQGLLYQNGQYSNDSIMVQNMDQFSTNPSTAAGVKASFIDNYSILCSLPELTDTDVSGDTFLMMTNNTTHEPMLLKEPEYEPARKIDNTGYDYAHRDRFTVEGRTLPVRTVEDMKFYHTNMAALLKLGAWFDYMREQGVYDNTRIILVSDHGKTLGMYPSSRLMEPFNADIFVFNPLLMVKDFHAGGFHIDYRFMTNADTPSLALDSLVVNPVNPATGRPVTSDAKYAPELHVAQVKIGEWNINQNHGNRFNPMNWASVKNHYVFDMQNWKYIGTY